MERLQAVRSRIVRLGNWRSKKGLGSSLRGLKARPRLCMLGNRLWVHKVRILEEVTLASEKCRISRWLTKHRIWAFIKVLDIGRQGVRYHASKLTGELLGLTYVIPSDSAIGETELS